MKAGLDLKIVDSIFDPEIVGPDPFRIYNKELPRKVYVWTNRSKPLYKVWIFLQGNDLPYVESVTYHLHPTFSEPVRVVNRTLSNPNCQLIIWTWGLFEVKAIVLDKMGTIHEIKHNLKYGELLSQPGIEVVPIKSTSSGWIP